MGSPSPLGRPCAPSPPGVWLHRSPYPELPTPISAAAPHCYSTSARRHDRTSGCSASLRPSPDALLCFPLLLMRCSALPSAPLLPLPLSPLLPLPLWSVLSDRQPPPSPLQDLPRAPLSALYFSRTCQFLRRASSLCALLFLPRARYFPRPFSRRPELDPCMAPATHDLARIGRQSDKISGRHGRKADAIRI